MCKIAFQLVFQQCYETSTTVLPHFLQEHFVVICGAFITGEGGKGRYCSRDSLQIQELRRLNLCNIEIGIAASRNKSQ